MKRILLILVLACLAIQYPLYLGDFGYKRVDELNAQLQAQRDTNRAMMARNNAMQAEIEDLKTGTQALEDYARSEMSMVASNEVLVRILTPQEEAPSTIKLNAPPQKIATTENPAVARQKLSDTDQSPSTNNSSGAAKKQKKISPTTQKQATSPSKSPR